jgi:hypothetical protein
MYPSIESGTKSEGWTVIPVTPAVDKLVRELDEFVASQSAEDS